MGAVDDRLRNMDVDEKDRAVLYDAFVCGDHLRLLGTQNIECSWVLDIGANVGYSVLAERKRFPTATIVAVEPSPTVFRRLKVNTQSFDIVALNIPFGDGSPVGDGVERASEASTYFPPGGTTTTYRLDNICRLVGLDWERQPFFLKIDVEGAERFLLDARNAIVLKKASLLSVELHLRLNGNDTSLLSCDECREIVSLIAESHRTTTRHPHCGQSSLALLTGERRDL